MTSEQRAELVRIAGVLDTAIDDLLDVDPDGQAPFVIVNSIGVVKGLAAWCRYQSERTRRLAAEGEQGKGE